MQLNHLHFKAKNPEEAALFYKTYFGFEPHMALGQTRVLKNTKGFILGIDPLNDSTTVEAASENKTNPRPLHFGFCLNSPEEVQSLFDALKKNSSIIFQQELKKISPNAINFYCFDPAGNEVEVGWYRSLVFPQ